MLKLETKELELLTTEVHNWTQGLMKFQRLNEGLELEVKLICERNTSC
jgi:hypothetical protein